MPELPEVEVTRRSIAHGLHGARVRSVRLGKPLRRPLGIDAQALVGARLGATTRRGKYLWLPLSAPRTGPMPGPTPAEVEELGSGPSLLEDGQGAGVDGGLLVHLGMSGSLALLDAPPTPGPHAHFDLVTDRGTLRLTDPRRFGSVVYAPALDADPAASLLERLGAEPFDPQLTPASLHAALRRHKVAIKPLLLGGTVVVGAGNIYACEALFRAGIHPEARSNRIGIARSARLLEALRATLERAVDLGGTTLRDFSDAHGALGAFQSEASVYGREGLPCVRCRAPVRRVVQAQRSTYYCPRCQRP